MKRKGKKLLITAVSLVLVAATAAGVWFWAGSANSEPVNVYPFSYLGMTEYWGDSQETYGFVRTDGVQTVYLSSTQTVTEFLVQEGDIVERGDILMTFDTTLSDLALERKRLDVEKLKLQLQDAKDRLAEINSMRPMVIPTCFPRLKRYIWQITANSSSTQLISLRNTVSPTFALLCPPLR